MAIRTAYEVVMPYHLHSKHNVRQPIAVYGNLFISLNYKYIS